MHSGMGWHCFAKKRAVRIVAAVLHYFLCCAVSTKPQKSHFKQRRMWNADSGEFLRKPYFFSNDMKTCKLKKVSKKEKKRTTIIHITRFIFVFLESIRGALQNISYIWSWCSPTVYSVFENSWFSSLPPNFMIAFFWFAALNSRKV